MALLEASGIGKNFGDTKVLKDISLTLEQGEAPTKTRKKMAVENSGQIRPFALYSLAIMMISLLAMVLASEVSLNRVMISLPMGGRMRLTTCSRVTLKKICVRVMPST